MPSPVLHLAAGAAICSLDRGMVDSRRWRFILPVMAASLLPDLDVLPGLLVGDPNRFHSGYSHSMGFAALAAVATAMLVRSQCWRTAGWVFVSWTVHVLLDGLTVDGRLPYGVPVFWPFSSVLFYSPHPAMPSFRHGSEGATLSEFFLEVFSAANLQSMMKEILLAAVLISVCYGLGRLLERRVAS